MSRVGLFIDDSDSLRETLDALFRMAALAVYTFPTWALAARWAEDNQAEVAIVVSDFDFGLRDTIDGNEVLRRASSLWPEARRILCSGLHRDTPIGIVDRLILKSELPDLLDEFRQALDPKETP